MQDLSRKAGVLQYEATVHSKETRTLTYLPGIFHHEDWLRFIQLSPFSRKWEKLNLDDEDLRALESIIMADPTRPPVIEGSGGLRKLRFAGRKSSKGKSGSARVFFTLFPEYGTVLLITAFGKNERDDLTDAGKKVISAVIRQIQDELDKGDL